MGPARSFVIASHKLLYLSCTFVALSWLLINSCIPELICLESLEICLSQGDLNSTMKYILNNIDHGQISAMTPSCKKR